MDSRKMGLIQDLRVSRKIVHEKYEKTKYATKHDIALLRVKSKINFNYQNVDSICLPVSDKLRNTNLTGIKGTVTGWGLTESHHESNLLLKVDLPILSDNECQSKYNRFNSSAAQSEESNNPISNEFCAGMQGKDSCEGDSGGPFLIEGDYNGSSSLIQYGIVSRGPKQCGSTYPGIYTDVRKYMDWILEKIEP